LQIERQIEVTKFFLEHVDFSNLRIVNPELSSIIELPFTPKLPDDYRKIKIKINHRHILIGKKDRKEIKWKNY